MEVSLVTTIIGQCGSPIVIGHGNHACSGSCGATVLGTCSFADSSTGKGGSVSLGSKNTISGGGTVVGNNGRAYNSGVAIGNSAVGYGVAIGSGSYSGSSDGVAIGKSSVAGSNAVAIGAFAEAHDRSTFIGRGAVACGFDMLLIQSAGLCNMPGDPSVKSQIKITSEFGGAISFRIGGCQRSMSKSQFFNMLEEYGAH